MKNVSVLLLLGIIVLAAILRFYQLGTIPNGLYQDETAIGYNAYSILKTGKDEHGTYFPLYFKSFGDWKLPVYIYSTIPFIQLFGLNGAAVRFPSALFGVLSVFMMYLFTSQLFKRKDLALLSSFILAITPWHIHYSRATFEVSICLFLYLAGGHFLLRGFQNKKNWAFVVGTLLFVVNLYTYNLTRLLTPLLYVLFLAFFFKEVKRIPKTTTITSIILAGLGLVPLILTLAGSGGASSARGTLITTSATIQSELLELRSYLIYLPVPFTKLFFNSYLLTFWVYLEHIVSYFSVSFLFLTGSTHGNHGIGNVGQFYLFMLPPFLIGLVYALLSKTREWIFLLLFAFVVILVTSLTREAPHATRSYFLLIPFSICIAQGLVLVYRVTLSLTQQYLRLAISALVVIIIAINIVYYVTSYYVRFPILYAPAWRSEDDRLSQFLVEQGGQYDQIVVDKTAGNIYTSILFYQMYPPSDFQKTAVYSPDDSEGFSEVESFGKYQFRPIDWEKDSKEKRTLFVTTSFNIPSNAHVLGTIHYPVRPVVSALGQEIISYPVEDIAYVIVESE